MDNIAEKINEINGIVDNWIYKLNHIVCKLNHTFDRIPSEDIAESVYSDYIRNLLMPYNSLHLFIGESKDKFIDLPLGIYNPKSTIGRITELDFDMITREFIYDIEFLDANYYKATKEGKTYISPIFLCSDKNIKIVGFDIYYKE